MKISSHKDVHKTFAWLKHPQVSPNQHKWALRFKLRNGPRKIASEIPDKWPVKGFQDVGSTTFVDGLLSFFRPPERINCQVTRPVFHSHIEGTPVDPPYPLTWLDMLKLLCRASIFELSHPKPIETSLVTLVYSFIPIMSLSYTRIRYICIYVSYIIFYIYICYIIYYIIISLYKHTSLYIYTIYKPSKPIMSPRWTPPRLRPEALLARCEDKDGGVRRSAVKALEKARDFRPLITGRPRNPFL